MKEGLPFARDLSLEKPTQILTYVFFTYTHLPSSSLCTVFDSISSTLEYQIIVPPAN